LVVSFHGINPIRLMLRLNRESLYSTNIQLRSRLYLFRKGFLLSNQILNSFQVKDILMPLKKDLHHLTSIFILLIIFLLFAVYYLLQGAYLHSTILLVSMIPLFILIVLKGKSMKKEYPEEY